MIHDDHAPTVETCAVCATAILTGQECWSMATPLCGPCFTNPTNPPKENTPQ